MFLTRIEKDACEMTEQQQEPMRRYHKVVGLEREQIRSIFREGTPQEIVEALLAITFHDPDRVWVAGLGRRMVLPICAPQRSPRA